MIATLAAANIALATLTATAAALLPLVPDTLIDLLLGGGEDE